MKDDFGYEIALEPAASNDFGDAKFWRWTLLLDDAPIARGTVNGPRKEAAAMALAAKVDHFLTIEKRR